ncbi:hypothetical protein MUP01_04690 [Candidatus Bathyarchaeota archaeon]|nr:hypothetical protein [Candidatus Bathyarchaeota archaeon]
MPILAEMVRDLATEAVLKSDSTLYTRNNTGWGTIHDYGNVVAPQAGFLVFKFAIDPNAGAGSYRLKVGSNYAWGTNTGSSLTITFICYVTAGTYDILMEGRNTGGETKVSTFTCGFVDFSDLDGSALALYSSPIAGNITARNTPIGALKNAMWQVQIFAYTPSGQTNFENPGDSLTNGVSLTIDSVQVTFTERNQDTGSKECASAKFYGSYPIAGGNHTFAISKDNANTVVYVALAVCPWLLNGSNHEPVSLDFPDFSTLYVTTEPLDLNPTKNVYLGKVRSASYGTATDYYYALSGTGILAASYTFELVSVSPCQLQVNGLGGAISMIGVDER